MPENKENTELDDKNLKDAVEKFRLQHPDIRCMSISTVRDTRFGLPEANQVAPFFCPGLKGTRTYDQPHCSNEEHLERLKNRGLETADEDSSIDWLSKIGYYRFKGYALLFREVDCDGSLKETYQPDSRFEDVIKLYEFDRHLRLLLLDGIERVEIAFRTRLIDEMCSKYGSHWLQLSELFSDKRNSKSGLPVFDHFKFISNAYRDARRSKESRSIQHYYRSYGDPVLPPTWMLSEVFSMGTWSKIYASLAHKLDKKGVAESFYTSVKEMESWIHVLTNLRNACAHHHRVFDKHCITNPSSKANLKSVISRSNRDRLYSQIATLYYCLRAIEPETQFFDNLSELVKTVQPRVAEVMGFDEEWEGRLGSIHPKSL